MADTDSIRVMRVADEIRELVELLTPWDELESRHRAECLAWLAGTDDIFRRQKPRTPSPHLVAYFLLRDATDGAVLLVDHRGAGMWLPSGGHVEPGEHPVATVRREMVEELGVPAVFAPEFGERPAFLTVTDTVGPPEQRHTDVSLWFVLSGSRDQKLVPDPGEFHGVRWWTPQEVSAAVPGTCEPHLSRVLAKLTA
ncbi:NUDIX hydrolase [Micromonospora coerulea]|uniref:NUDIX hydrolase n=1 Tax=Micromonospora coerulea TaxID=47856 RepID=A0ABP8SF65_9ACTN